MITAVEVRTAQGSLLTLSLEDVIDGLIVEDVGGLDPVKATIVTSSFAQMDGTQYHSVRRESRNITLKLGLEPDYVTTSVSDLRQRLYEYLMPKSEVFLRFYQTNGNPVEIFGMVETCEAPLFVKEPQMDVSIFCFDSDLIDPIPVVVPGNTVSTTTDSVITYPGTVETGIDFTLNINRALTQFTIYHRRPDGSLRTVDFSGNFVAGDVLKVRTIPGNKFVQLTRAGVVKDFLYAKSPQSDWTEFKKGDNRIRVYATGAAIPYTISYLRRYGGL